MKKPMLQPTDSLDAFLERLSPEPHLRGKEFERAAKWFLETDPAYASELEEVWLWDDWPGRWGPDNGIDLVAETQEGKLWAIQVKCFDPESQVPTSQIDSFISASSRPEFDQRLLISTGPISRNAEFKLTNQDKPTALLLYHQLIESPVDWLAFLDDSRPVLPNKKTPRPHQQKAIDDVIDGFSANDRGRLIMACGTGKTLVGVWVAERLMSVRTLVLVPSLALVSQISLEWQTDSTEPFRALFVCSDQTVADDNFLSSTAELGHAVTTDPRDIQRFMSGDGARVVFSTYQSSPQIAAAQASGAPAFDLVIADEAHHCAGKVDSAFATVMDADSLQATRRLFMTATPRIVPKAVRDVASMNEVLTTSMDDESQFGPEFHHLTFGRAIEDKILSDYQLVILGVNSEDISNLITDRRLVEQIDPDFRGDAESLATYIAMLKAIKKYTLSKVITFHNRVVKADEFQKTLSRLNANFPRDQSVPDLRTNHIRGTMRTADRKQILKQFKNAYPGTALLSNARCLGEGVDIRSIDGIGFIDPKRSAIDIVQAVGRAIRKNDADKIGTIVIPVFIDEASTETVEEQLGASRFEPIWRVIRALRDHDEVLSEEIDQLRFQMGRHGRVVGKLPAKIVLDIDSKFVGVEFRTAIATKIIETTTHPWEFWDGLLEKYVEEFGDAIVPNKHEQDGFTLGRWVEKQRGQYRRGVLSKERIVRLERFETWIWDGQDFHVVWGEHFRALQIYVTKLGDAMVPNSWDQDGFALGTWVEKQRSAYRQDRLSSERINALKGVTGWSWDGLDLDAVWEGHCADLLSFVEADGHANVPMTAGDPLATWVDKQRQAYKSGRLPADRISKLKSLNGWVWDKFDAGWETGFAALQKFHAREGNANVPQKWNEGTFDLGRWVSHQRTAYAKRLKWEGPQSNRVRLINDDQIARLNGLGFVWELRAAKDAASFEEGLNAYKKYVTEHKTYRVQPGYKDENGYPVDSWMQRNKRRYAGKRGSLSTDQIAALESVAGVKAEVALAPLRAPNRAK